MNLSPAESQSEWVAQVAAEKARADADAALLVAASERREAWEARCAIYEDMLVALTLRCVRQQDVLDGLYARLVAAGERCSALEAENVERQGVPADVAAVYQTGGGE